MKKCTTTAYCLFIFLWLCAGHARCTTIVVTGRGSIREAIGKAAPHDTLVVKKGIYHEHGLTIHTPLTLLGEGYPVIDAQEKGEIINVFSDSVHIEGFQLQGVGVSFLKELAAVRLNRVSHITLRNNRIYDTFFGIYVQYGKYCTLENNHIKGSNADDATAGNAIHVWKADHIQVLNNITEHHRDGIYFEFVDHSTIRGNESFDNLRYGLHFMFSNDDVYSENIFRRNGAGVAVMFSRHIRMEQNVFAESRGAAAYGILLKEISHGQMHGNVFSRNTVGIYAEGATAISIRHNDFISNGKAIDIMGNCIDNEIAWNNFFANTFEVYTNTKSNLNRYHHNYWSQYRGYDLDRDGTGDEPYRPVNLMASVTHEVPAACILLHSFLANTMDAMEKSFPELIPETLIDNSPLIKPVHHDRDTTSF